MRKVILLCAAICCISTLATAQIEKGRVQLEGGFSYSNRDFNQITDNSLQISPQVGFFISDNISIGPSINYSRRSTEQFNQANGNTIDRVLTDFQFGAFARFHKSIADKFYLFAESSVRLGTGNLDDGLGNETDLSSFNVDIRPGAMYFLSDRFTLGLDLAFFTYSSQDVGAGQDINTFSFGTNLSNVGISLSYFLK